MAETIIEQLEDYALRQDNRRKALFSKIGIVGCGTTGQRITLMIATRGIEVVFLELSEKKIKQSFEELEVEMNNRIEHWGMTDGDKRSTLSRVKGTTDYEDFRDCDLVIDAILSTNREFALDIRKSVFKNVEEHVSPNTIIATNSTTTVITELSSELKYKNRCISLHFSTTAPDASIVEVVRGYYTSSDVCDKVRIFAKLIDKNPIPVAESSGLISVRLFAALISEACDVLMEGVANLADIDTTMKNGLGLPLGPFEMADKIGIDRVVRWMDNLYKEFGDKKYKPSPLIKRLYRAQELGRKNRKGFYCYDERGNKMEINSIFNKHIGW